MSALPTNRPRSLTLVSDDMFALEDMLLEVGGDVTEQTVSDFIDAQLAEISSNKEAGVDRYAGLINEMELRSSARKAESKRLADLAATDSNAANRLRARLKWFFEQHGSDKVKTPRFNVTIAKNGGVEPLGLPEDINTLPTEFVEWVPKARTTEIRAALAAGTDIPGVSLGERGTSLRIK